MLVLRTFSEVVRWDACCLFKRGLGVRWGDLVGMIGKRLSLILEGVGGGIGAKEEA